MLGRLDPGTEVRSPNPQSPNPKPLNPVFDFRTLIPRARAAGYGIRVKYRAVPAALGVASRFENGSCLRGFRLWDLGSSGPGFNLCGSGSRFELVGVRPSRLGLRLKASVLV